MDEIAPSGALLVSNHEIVHAFAISTSCGIARRMFLSEFSDSAQN
jgi:hypothetical protein